MAVGFQSALPKNNRTYEFWGSKNLPGRRSGERRSRNFYAPPLGGDGALVRVMFLVLLAMHLLLLILADAIACAWAVWGDGILGGHIR